MFSKQQIIKQVNRIKRRIQIKEQRRKVSGNQSNRMQIVKKKIVILNKCQEFLVLKNKNSNQSIGNSVH